MNRSLRPARTRSFLALPAALLVLEAVMVPTSARAQLPLDIAIPPDPAVTVGQLENGLRYYVRQNDRPENRAELRLVVNAGSVLEDDSQRGLAHLVEHMAFNGTEHFEKQELIDYLESIGMQFGPSINASTSFDETVYMLQVPTDDPEIMETAFQILEDWAHLVSFEPEEVDQERGVVIEEWRQGRGAGARMLDEQLPVMFAGSRYAERLPIGSVDVLESFAHEELVRFYRTWYRPDLMAVMAVGDFEVEAVEELIRTYFSRVPVPATPLTRPVFDVPSHEETYFAFASDPEAATSRVGLMTMQDPPSVGTVGDYRQSLTENLANGMLNDRLSELAQQADPPFLVAGTSRGRFVRTRSAYQLIAASSEDGMVRAMEVLLTEAERAARHGFTNGELERAKLDLLRGLERTFTERENLPSASHVSRYVNHFLHGSPFPSIEFSYRAAQALVPGITLAELNEVARNNLDPRNRVVLLNGIEKPGLALPDEDDLRAVFDRVALAEIEPYEDTALDQPLVSDLPAPGSIVTEDEVEVLGVTVWRLSNGASVWLKPTDFKDDEIIFGATSPGGWSRSSLEDHQSATNAAPLVQIGGVGDFSLIDLGKALAGKSVGVSPSIAEVSEGFSGQASPQDLETLFQLVWLYFTAPREDSTAFQAFRAQAQAMLANRSADPMTVFADTLAVTMTQHHPRVRPPTPDILDDIELGRAVEFYRDRFASASDFVFVFVGALDLDEMRPLVEQYLAALPAVERDDSWVDLDIDPPEGVVETVVRRGIEARSHTRIAFTGPFEYSAPNRLGVRALAAALELRLREVLREELGGTYSVGTNGSYGEEPEPRYTLQIDFGSDPERAEELRTAVFREIERLKAEGPTAEEVAAVVESERRSQETSLESNGWWTTQLLFASGSQEDLDYLVDPARFDALSIESIRRDAELYLRSDRYVLVVLMPQGVGRPN